MLDGLFAHPVACNDTGRHLESSERDHAKSESFRNLLGLWSRQLGLLLSAIGLVMTASVPGTAAEPASPVPPLQVPVDLADGLQRATVILDSYSYTPQRLIVQAGKPVELLLTSITSITPHNFVVKDEATGLSIERDVSAGKTVTVQFTPMKPGIYTFYCDKKLLFLPSHREKGMEGTLEVR